MLLLLFSTLHQLARPDDFWRRGRIWRQRPRDEHADMLLIGFVLWIFAGSDVLRKVGGALKEQNQDDSADASPAVWGVGGKATPLVEHEPNGLLGKEIGVSAVCPEAPCDEAPF